ncbi:MAG: undecaprenyl-phosphate alpha-N-acetylglucosaminyltransferase [Bacteroidetes bacterium]|nr:undecaprenyl-phosphate alpha-N-acetylglucosaminyltransferase [Bacteroidota bacterium]
MIINDYTFSVILLIIALFIALIAETMALPRIIYISKKKKLYDIPDARKLHVHPVPRLAGISFFPIMLFAISVCALIASTDYNLQNIHEPTLIRLTALIGGCLLLWGIGVRDDTVGVRYKNKIITQLISAIILVSGNLYINNFNGLFGIWTIPDWAGILFTIGLVMFITNAINLIDGADGLASGISGVALITFGYLFLERGMFFYTLICIIMIGILIPFFYFNVFNTTRKLFMGDTGSLTLGYLLAFLGVRYAMDTDANYNHLASPIIISLSAMFIPLFDALRVMLERMCKGKSPFQPDRRHIHHKLLNLGFSHRKTMVWLVICAEIFVILNTNLVKILNINLVFTMDMIIWLGLIQTLNFLRRKKDKNSYAID